VDSGGGLARLDFDFVGVSEELRVETEGFALQGEVDEFEGLPGLLLGGTSRDLVGIELKVEPAEGDGFQAGLGLTNVKAASWLRMPMTLRVVGGTGRVNTTLQMVFTQPWRPMKPMTGVQKSFSA
jgi:hypothetical protein